jgi:chromosome segregation ATPase
MEEKSEEAKEEKIVFDTASGFSVEEQREILNEINALARKTRIAAPEEPLKTVAKKRGLLFPVLVNIGALLLLVSGFFLLMYFHSREDADIREGSIVLGLTERKLIQEIRQETSRLIGEKEKEINDYLAKLADAGAEYRELEASVESLTEEQQQRAEYLLMVQDEYRGAITGLQEERAKILEEARSRETELRAQAEARVRELSSQVEQSASELTAAQEELSRLASEQERAARAEGQLGGYYQQVNESIRAGELDNAAARLKSMREFLNTPSLRGIRSLENRKQAHLAAIDSLELITAEALRAREAANSAAAGASSDGAIEAAIEGSISAAALSALTEEAEALQKQIETLEATVRQQQAAIAAFSAQDSETGRLVAGYEERINGLQTQVSTQQQALNQRDASISALQVQADGQREQIVEQDRRIVALQGQAENLNRTIANNETAIGELRTRNETLTRANEDLTRQIETIRESARQLLEQ